MRRHGEYAEAMSRDMAVNADQNIDQGGNGAQQRL
jgi:hypothetical protein